MNSDDHINFFSQMVRERGPLSTRRLKKLGSDHFENTRFNKKYIYSCLNNSQTTRFSRQNCGLECGSGKFNLMLWKVSN